MIKIETLLESGCNTKQVKVCRERGGESCAFDGAMIVLQPIKDTLHIVHGPIGCLSNYFNSRGSVSSDEEKINFTGIGTDLGEIDIVYGGENKLMNTIIDGVNKFKPKAVFVYSTCITGLIGEDIERICKESEKTLKIPVIPVDSPGFIGPKNLGNRVAGKVLLDYVIGTKNPPYKTPFDINIIGEYNIAGDLYLVEPLFREAGIRILSKITGDATFDEICYAHHARLNVMVCSRALINVAKGMEQKYGIPYIEVSFFGMTEFSKALRLIAYKLDGAIGGPLSKRVEEIIQREESLVKESLKKFSPKIEGKKAFLYTGGVKSWSFINALKDIGITIAGVGVKKSSYEDEEKIVNILGSRDYLVENVNPQNILKIIREKGVDILIAGGRNQYLAVKENIPFIDVNQERHTAYAGYSGMINLAVDIYESITFYERLKNKRERAVRPVNLSERNNQINPIKNSPLLGGIIASQGFKDCLPVVHGAKGCSFLPKVLLTKHFREPILLFNTSLYTESIVLGSEESLYKKLDELITKKNPSIVAILNAGLIEVKGESIEGLLKELRKKHPERLIFSVKSKDYEQGLESGYSKFLESLILSMEPKGYKGNSDSINIFTGPHLSPADHRYLKEVIKSFGLKLNLIPDLSTLCGNLKGYPELTYGGAGLDSVKRLSRAKANIIIGTSLRDLKHLISSRTGKETYVFESLGGVREFKKFLNLLSRLSGKKIPKHFIEEERILLDTMKDAHFYMRNTKICTALQVEESMLISQILNDLNVGIELAIVPEKIGSLERIGAEKIVIGDLECIDSRYDLLISNSHAVDISKRLSIPLYQHGFPLFRFFNGGNLLNFGFRGSARIITDIVNLLIGGKQ